MLITTKLLLLRSLFEYWYQTFDSSCKPCKEVSLLGKKKGLFNNQNNVHVMCNRYICLIFKMFCGTFFQVWLTKHPKFFEIVVADNCPTVITATIIVNLVKTRLKWLFVLILLVFWKNINVFIRNGQTKSI